MSDKLASEKVVVSAPFSFAGSAERVWKITNTDNGLLKWLLLVPVALTLIMFAWMFVATWYFIMYIIFGIFFIPFRLWRRGARKNKRNELRHREVLEAINNGKMERK
jgi:Flp pilus assembly protein TadB